MRLMDVMENYLKDESYIFLRADDKEKIILFLPYPSLRVCVEICSREERRSLMVDADGGVLVPFEKRPEVMEFLTRANYGTIFGCFQMDLADGEVYFRTSLISRDDVPQTMMGPLVQAAASTYAAYHPGLMAILYQNANALQALSIEATQPEVTAEQVEEGCKRLLTDLEEPSFESDETSTDGQV